MVSDPCRNPRRLIQSDQRSLSHLKIEIEVSKYKLFFIKHILSGSTQPKFYLIKGVMEHLGQVDMRYYGVYQCWWYIRQHKDFTQHLTMECIFWTKIRDMKQDVTLGKMLPLRPLRINDFLQNYKNI